MRQRRMRDTAGLLAMLAVLALPIGLAAAETPDEIIAARQAGYKHIGDIADAMKTAVRDGGEVAGLAGPAAEIAAWGRKAPTLFPAGTQSGHDTKARPEIWSDRAGFEAAAAAMVTEAAKLATLAASGDKAGFAEQFRAMGAACGGCHRSYRYRS